MAADNQSPELFGQTPWQTVGPFFHYALPWKGAADLVGQAEIGARPELFAADHDTLTVAGPKGPIAGEAIEIVGRVLDAAGQPVVDAVLEIWQANAAGRYHSSADPRDELPLDEDFTGFGRASTAEDGSFRFRTIRPGPVPGPGDSLQAPHIALGVLGRGILKRLVTRIYFEGEPANAEDTILELVPEARRRTLIARREEGGARYRFDVLLQGEDETVFFDC